MSLIWSFYELSPASQMGGFDAFPSEKNEYFWV